MSGGLKNHCETRALSVCGLVVLLRGNLLQMLAAMKGMVYVRGAGECRWWRERFGVTPEALRARSAKSGPMMQDIERHFRVEEESRATPPQHRPLPAKNEHFGPPFETSSRCPMTCERFRWCCVRELPTLR